MIATISRPMPSKKDFARDEGYLGRYCQQNIPLLAWIERMLQFENDREGKTFDWIIQNVFDQSPFRNVARNPQLYD